MKFEGSVYKIKGDEPDFFQRFAQQYAFVTKFLTEFNSNRFRFSTDVKSVTTFAQLAHGVETQVPHSLGTVPERVLVTGRVECYINPSNTNNTVSITAKLLTTRIHNPPFGKLVGGLTVEDPTLFRVGDSVRIGTVTRNVSAILGNVVTLDQTFVCDTVYVMSLSTETVKVILF